MPERGVKERERTEDRPVGRSENPWGKYVVHNMLGIIHTVSFD